MPHIERLVIYSRDELNNGKKKISPRFFIGDVRDIDRLKMAFDGIDCVIHAAALKQVSTADIIQ